MATRPTPQRAREALLSMWLSMGPLGAGLDLFAGSGAVGIEALSRGAAKVAFIEHAAPALVALRRNLAGLPAALSARAYVTGGAFPAALGAAQRHGPFDWIFDDPPFAGAPYAEVLAALASDGLSLPRTSLVVEHDSKVSPPEHARWRQQRSRRFGAVTFTFYGKSD